MKKILIANRGEVAVRIVRACAELGIRSAAIYTDADRHALHVKKADEAYHIGPDSVAAYLNAHRIANLAVATGCDAVHPGYGFLSENAEFAEICARRRLTFIGPSPEAIRRMGDKTEARKTMQEAGVPVVPGSEGNVADVDEALAVAERIGYPVMLKATSGGGGRGIRRCDDAEELRRQFPRVVSEASKAFGRAEVFIEKCIVRPRHIEVQVLADKYGNVVHLFERDCSIQRRHQKLVEIAPSPQIDPKLRARLGELAVTAARAVGYENAGTVEFLVDADGNAYFMEMNTRLQVEHTVTEQVTGIDIVQEQIRIAGGARLAFRQEDVQMRGYAIQFRINAEDPKNDFLPSFGRITRYYAPGGPGVRTDAAIYTGYEIPPYYDSMVAKLVVWALDWKGAVARARRALRDIGVYGVRTTIPYHQRIVECDDFLEGRFDTAFVEEHPELAHYPERVSPRDLAAAIGAAIAAHAGL
ncbi:acetyl-CoA carboxylase biotin carboxylase subunit [Inmirania thermothiophila]|uniref:Biotin carboxylase n=1 Tax=Inmirania thermothiophila TaxID=1750597 RepID=A0A3N1Y285_9GAMM|nr:acetyl-CoA carboxylase biotin carboxylase subunit [Inmirania thermothiophila]ROR32641.1 biotin carboxylase /acetyl-CoA carboxylase carboxyltransferase subunit alpha [Inmirania thermothiophila]